MGDAREDTKGEVTGRWKPGLRSSPGDAAVKWLASLLAIAVLIVPAPADARRRRPCASNGMSCVPGPCCRGTKCDGNVCRKPEKEWSDGPKPGEWTPDNPRPLPKEEKKGK